jgi:hypothetical protein
VKDAEKHRDRLWNASLAEDQKIKAKLPQHQTTNPPRTTKHGAGWN